DALLRNRLLEARDDQIRHLGPAEISEHHLAREYHRARVDLVLVRVLWRGAVRGLEHGVAGLVVDVRPWRDPDATHLRGERIGDVVAVQVRRRDHIVLRRPRENLLQERIGNRVLDDHAVRQALPRAAVEVHRAILVARDLISPVTEAPFRELHDVALVDQRHALRLPRERIVDGGTDESRGPLLAYRLDADAARVRKAN